MEFLGDVQRILGTDIVRDKRKGLLRLTQRDYVLKVLKKFNMHEARSALNSFGVTLQTFKTKNLKMMLKEKRCTLCLMLML